MERSPGIRLVGVALLVVVHAVACEAAREDLGLPSVQRGDLGLEVERLAAGTDADHRASGPVAEVADRRAVADDWVPFTHGWTLQFSRRMRVLMELGDRPKCSAVCFTLRHPSQWART